jgi:phosphoglycolate phosphatase/pyrophosphatase PpaX
MLRFPCLVLDHDDTVVNSTATIHYPAYLEAIRRMGRTTDLTLEGYFRVNFDPGFVRFMQERHEFTDEDFAQEYEIWQECVRRTVPKVYPGMDAVIRRQVAEGGTVCVVSHSVDVNIRRDYRENGLPEPTLIYGWEQPRELRKPSPHPLYEIMRQLKLQPQELLVVDDLKPGLDMATAAGVPFAAALWAHRIPEIHAHMHRACENCFNTPRQLETWLFGA